MTGHDSKQDAESGGPDERADEGLPAAAPRPSLAELMLALAIVSISGFGGVLPWARRMLVDDKRWMTAEEFTTLFAVCQFLPGPNVVNMAAVFGLRLHGVIGAVAAVFALCAAPVALLIGIGALYTRYGSAPGISGAIAGLAAGVAGFMIATGVRLAEPLFRKRAGLDPLIAAAAFVAIGLLRLPLFLVLAVMVPASVALAWRMRR